PPPRCCRGSHRELGESPSHAEVSSHSSSHLLPSQNTGLARRARHQCRRRS
ncbi:hypothetical protein S83_052230, partial [Arachis hypogaea]